MREMLLLKDDIRVSLKVPTLSANAIVIGLGNSKVQTALIAPRREYNDCVQPTD